MNQVRVVALFALLVTALPAVRAKAAAAQHEGHLATGSPALIDAVRQRPSRSVTPVLLIRAASNGTWFAAGIRTSSGD